MKNHPHFSFTHSPRSRKTSTLELQTTHPHVDRTLLSTMSLRRSNRATRIDYAALNESHIVHERNVHPHIPQFRKFAESNIHNNDNLILIDKEYTTAHGHFNDDDLAQIVEETKLGKPILIRGANKNVPHTHNTKINISFNIPNYNIHECTTRIGPSVKVPVMDTMTQNNSRNWNMQRWCEYFSSKNHDTIQNVISLEISQTPLGAEIHVPRIVKQLDIINRIYSHPHFSKTLSENDIHPPHVLKYILMSVRNCYTDFHIDFAGTSVYYSLLKGHKQFILLPPTDRNLRAYKAWCLSESQQHVWFPTLVGTNAAVLVDVQPGDLLLLPSLWIHAVHTLDDSIIVGGNFLNAYSLENHLRAHRLEAETNVGDQFKFPQFMRFMWLLAYFFLVNGTSTEIDTVCWRNVVRFLQEEWLSVKSQRKGVAKLKAAVPRAVIGDPDVFLKKVAAAVQDTHSDGHPPREKDHNDQPPRKKMRRQPNTTTNAPTVDKSDITA